MKKVEEILTRQLKNYADKDLAIKKLEVDYTKSNQLYDELRNKMDTAMSHTINSKTRHYEELVVDMNRQLSVLLYENDRLRQHIEEISGKIILPLAHDLVTTENLSEDGLQTYKKIEELIQQNTELKNQINGLRSTSRGRPSTGHQGKQSHSHEQLQDQDVSKLHKRIETGEQQIKKVKENRDALKKTSDILLEENNNLNKRLRSLQTDMQMKELKQKNSDDIILKYKEEIKKTRNQVYRPESLLELVNKQQQLGKHNLSVEVTNLKSELQQCKSELERFTNSYKDQIWQKVEVVVDERPIDKSVKLVGTQIQVLVDTVQTLQTTMKQERLNLLEAGEYKQQVEVLKEQLASAATLYSEHEQYFRQQLDYLASVVNKMEEEYKKGVPDHIKSISLTSSSAWASPTLLCLKLKEEYLKIDKEYNLLKSQLSQENSSYLADNNSMKTQIINLSQQLADVTTKWHREREEREKVMSMIEGKERGLYDAIRFKHTLEENEDLTKQIDSLKQQLITEKKFTIDVLYDDSNAVTKVGSLSQEINLLGNIKAELVNQIKTLNEAHSLQSQEQNMKIQFLEKEKDLVYEKLVSQV